MTCDAIPHLEDDEAEFLWGAARIGKAIGLNPNVTFNLLRDGQIPARKIGGRWVSERNVLRRFVTPEAVAA